MKTDPLYFIISTLGCKVNQYESQALSEQLQAHGFLPAKEGKRFDLAIINTCAVTAESVRKGKQLVRRAIKQNPNAFVLVTGCATQLAGNEFLSIPGVDYVCGTRNKNTVVSHAIALREKGSKPSAAISCIPLPSGEMEPMSITTFERTRAYVKIQDGCNGKCAYCIIPSLRGTVVSRCKDDVIEEVTNLVNGGCKEIVLTGIETSAYQYGLADVIESIHRLDGLERIRLGSLDPSFMKPDFVDRISYLSKIAPHFHLSLQSGADSVLMRMKRRYLFQTVLDHVSYLRKAIPNVQLSTDIIVGFPGETEEEFEKSLSAVEQLRFLHVHVFPFSPRPGTPAATFPDQIPEDIKAQRVARLSALAGRVRQEILSEILNNNPTLSVLVETVDQNGICTGHSAEFADVFFSSEESITRGDFVQVSPIGIENGRLVCRYISKTGE